MEIPANQPKTLLEAIRFVSDLDVATEYVAKLRWPDGPVCPACGLVDEKHYYLKTRRVWKCRSCKKQFSVKVGTIFEDSSVGLDKWLAAIWMIANCKNGISSYELHRSIGVTQKTAWFMLHRIRLAMQAGTFEKLSGEVEADETYIGGKARNMHQSKRKEKVTGRGSSGKVAVMGLLERHGEVRTKVVPDTKSRTLQVEVRENVEPFHLFRYLDEQAFRFNEREGRDAERFGKALGSVAGKRLTYSELIGETASE